MGLYYNSFIDALEKQWNVDEKNMSIDIFLETNTVKKIYKEYDIHLGSLHWALNVEKFLENINEESTKYKDEIKSILEENAKCFIKNDFNY